MKIVIPWQACRQTRSGLRLAVAAVTTAFLLTTSVLFAQVVGTLGPTNVTTLTGGWGNNNGNPPYYGYNSYNNGPASTNSAAFDFPAGLTLEPSGNSLFIADCTNNAVRWYSNLKASSFPATQVYTFLYTNDGISLPVAVAVDGATNVYVLNRANGTNGNILEFTNVSRFFQFPQPGVESSATTIATHLTNATAMALDGLTNLYVTCNSNTVLRVTPGGVSSVVGIITNAGVNLRGVTVMDNDQLALTDAGNNGIWLMNLANGIATKFTGFHGAGDTNGPPFLSAFNHPENIAKADGGWLVVADRYNHKVKTIDASGNVYRLFGVRSNLWTGTGSPSYPPGLVDGQVDNYETNHSVEAREPVGIAIAPDGSVFDTEVYYHVIRHATFTGLTSTNGLPFPVLFNNPAGIALDSAGANLYLADYNNNAVQQLDLGNNQTAPYLTAANGIHHPASVMLDTNDYYFYVLNQNDGTNGNILSFDPWGNPPVTNVSGLNIPTAFTMDANGNIFVAEQSGTVLVVFPDGSSNTIATINTNANVSLQGIALFDDGTIAVSDAGNHVIWTINALTRTWSRLTGQFGIGGYGLGNSNQTKLLQPHQLARSGNDQLVIADTGTNRLLVVTRSGTITNMLNSTNASVWFGRPGDPYDDSSFKFVPMVSPVGVAVSSAGKVFASETYYEDIRGLNGTVTTPVPAPIVVLPYFNNPVGIAYDSIGNNLFIADAANNAIQELNLANNTTSTFLSASDGISHPASVLLDTNENVYVLNQNAGTNGSILEFDINKNFYSPLLTGLNQPTSFLLDGNGNFFVTEQSGNILLVLPSGISSIVATITNAGISLQGIALFDDGSIAVSDAGNHVIWTVNPLTKIVTKLTGQLGTNGMAVGTSNFAKLYQPHQLIRVGGNQIVAADYGNNRLVLIQRNGTVSTNTLNSSSATVWFGQAGDPVASGSPKFVPMVQPSGVAIGDGFVFASETYYEDIRGLTGSSVTAPAFNPGVPLPFFSGPAGIAVDASGNNLYIADTTNNAVKQLNLGDNLTTLWLTNGIIRPVSVLLDTNNDLYVLNQNAGTNGSILSFDPQRNLLATNATRLNQPTAFVMDANGNLFVAEQSGAVLVVYPNGATSTLVTVTNANVSLQGIALFDDGSIAVSDAGNHVIWTINILTRTVSLLTGQPGVRGSTLGASNFALLDQPHQLARIGNNQLVIADTGNNRLITVTRSGSVTNVLNSTNASVWFGQPGDPAAAGSPKFVPMVTPVGVAVSSAGNVYASETYYPDIRGLTATVTAPSPVNVLLPAFIMPSGIGFDPRDNYLYIADPVANAVKLLDLNSNLTSVFLTASNGLSQPVSVLVDTNKYIPYIYVLNQNGGANGSIVAFDIYGNPEGTNVIGLNEPAAFTEDGYGNFFVAEQAGAIRVFGAGVSNTIVTLTNAGVSLQGIAIFDDGSLAVSDAGNHVIWTVNPLTKAVSLLTGQPGIPGTTMGSNNVARLSSPHQLARAGNNQLLVADYGNNRLLTVTRNGYVTNVLNSASATVWFGQAGDPVASGSPKFVPMVQPSGVAIGDGFVFASETYYEDIRGLTGSSVTAPAFNPGVPLPFFSGPAGIAVDANNTILFSTAPANNLVNLLNLANNLTTVYLNSSNGLNVPVDVALDGSDNLYVLNQGTGGNGFILEFDRFGNLLKTNVTSLLSPVAMTLDNSGNIFVAEMAGTVRLITVGGSDILVTVVTNNASVQLGGIALLDDGTITVSDTGNHVIWQINPANKAVSLFTGQVGLPGKIFGSPVFAKLNQPKRLARAAGNLLVAADSGNNQIVIIDSSGAVTNALVATNGLVWFGLAGDPVNANYVPMAAPNGVALGTAGAVFASEDNIYKDIRKITGTGLVQYSPSTTITNVTTSNGIPITNIVIYVPPPAITPSSGYYPMGQTIQVVSQNPVYYTTDGSTPTIKSAPVTLVANTGYIRWFNTTNDLTSLHVGAFNNITNTSAMVSGQPVVTNNIGTPPGPNLNPNDQNIYAGVGSSIVIPVVCNLNTNSQIESFQFRYEIVPINNGNTPVMVPLNITPTNDFVPLVTAAQSGFVATNTLVPYTHGTTNGLSVYAIGAGNHILFKNFAVIALLDVQIPPNANPGDTYSLNVLYPSATSDGYSGTVILTPMAQVTIVVSNILYTVGDAAGGVGSWYNAGTFGDDNLDNSDVNQAFDAASGLRTPYAFSDAFNAMDAYPPDTAGNPGGDGQIRLLDWNTILQRALRLNTSNWAREWSAGGNLVDVTTNLILPAASPYAPVTKTTPYIWYKQALVGGVSIGNATPGSTVNLPVYVTMQYGSTLGGLQFRTLVTPQNNAPALASAPQFNSTAGVVSPFIQQSFKAGETAFGWSLVPAPSFNCQPGTSNFLGWVSFTIPSTAQSGQVYTVSFPNADGAPDMSTQYDLETRSANVTVNGPAIPASICSDEWKIYFFGSVTNPLAADSADHAGTGMPNWMAYLAGTDPTSPASRFQFSGIARPKGLSQASLQWLTAPGKAYELQWSTNLAGGAWNTLTTVIGSGVLTNCVDTNAGGAARYYRLHLLLP